MKSFFISCYSKLILVVCAIVLSTLVASSQQPLNVGVAGLSHDHVNGLMEQYKRGDVIIAGIAEADEQLAERYKRKFQLPDSLFFKNLTDLLKHKKPDAVLAYNPISEHLDVVKICAPKGISVMVEKPLATTVTQAEQIVKLANQYNIKVLTNYETTWYASNQQVYEITNEQHGIGEVRKMIVHSGHEGPKKIGCSQDFLNWLTDPVKNGAGALTDFGCYGANLMTWMMHGTMPVSVLAITKHIQPEMYPKVDDEATILLEYPEAIGIIEASWNWPFGIKDMEVYGTTGYLHAVNSNTLLKRGKDSYDTVTLKPPMHRDNIPYLTKVLKGEINTVNDLSSLENNLTVVKILEAALKSARESKKILLK
jgi:predicted dehydrogenase